MHSHKKGAAKIVIIPYHILFLDHQKLQQKLSSNPTPPPPQKNEKNDGNYVQFLCVFLFLWDHVQHCSVDCLSNTSKLLLDITSPPHTVIRSAQQERRANEEEDIAVEKKTVEEKQTGRKKDSQENLNAGVKKKKWRKKPDK